jgi:hypothetical protein
MDYKGKIDTVDGCEQTLEPIDPLGGVACIANQTELERAILGVDGGETD